MKRPWIDTHIHVSDLGPGGQRRERMLEDLLDVLDRCDADLRFVVSCDGPYYGYMAKDPSQMLPANRMIYDLVRRAPGRLYGACMVNPNFLDESLRVMNVCLGEWGFVMLGEMLQYSMKYRMNSDAAEQCVRLAVRYDVPIQVHLGTYWFKDDTGGSSDGMDHMRDLLKCAERVPEAKYILAHAIGCGPTPNFVPWADMFLDTLAGGVLQVSRQLLDRDTRLPVQGAQANRRRGAEHAPAGWNRLDDPRRPALPVLRHHVRREGRREPVPAEGRVVRGLPAPSGRVA